MTRTTAGLGLERAFATLRTPVATQPTGGRTLAVPSAGYDVALYLLSSAGPGCPSGVGNSVTNCVAAVNSGGPGATEVIPPTFGLPSGDYYLFVDSPVASGSASAGTYQVFLNSFCPVELIEYTIE